MYTILCVTKSKKCLYTCVSTMYTHDFCYLCIGTLESLFKLTFTPACCSLYCFAAAQDDSICYKENMYSTKIKTFIHTWRIACHSLNYQTQGCECEWELTLYIFHHIQEKEPSPTGHWERDPRKESLKEGQEQNHALCQPIQPSPHKKGHAHY